MHPGEWHKRSGSAVAHSKETSREEFHGIVDVAGIDVVGVGMRIRKVCLSSPKMSDMFSVYQHNKDNLFSFFPRLFGCRNKLLLLC